MKNNIKKLVTICYPNETTQTVIIRMSKSTTKIFGFCCVVDTKFRLIGIINSGDILRGLSKNNNTSTTISELMNEEPVFINEGYQNENILEEISKKLKIKTKGRKKFTRFIPVIKSSKKLIDVIDLYELIGSNPSPKPSVTIYGMGYVGLTLAAALSSIGMNVVGIDNNKV